MFGRIKRKATELNYRIKIRQALQQANITELEITKDELTKEFERRNKKRSKKK